VCEEEALPSLVLCSQDRIVNKNLPLRREEVPREEAERRIKEIGEPYKLEILQGLQEPITIYHIGTPPLVA